MAQIHRFGDCVAVYVGDGRTVYMTPKDARRLAKALTECARDIARHSFTAGQFKTACIELTGTGHNGTNYTHRRPAK